MRLPWGTAGEIAALFLASQEYVLLGCLSFEERCRAVPVLLAAERCLSIELLEVHDPSDAFPDRSVEAQARIETNRQALLDAGIQFQNTVSELLIAEDGLLSLLAASTVLRRARTIVLDITSLPKRYFCFLLKRLLLFEPFDNVVVTYTQVGQNGYARGHLAEDPMSCDHLPGFAAPLPPAGDTLVVSVGFESLSIRSLVEVYKDRRKDTKLIVSFPADLMAVRREWTTLRQMTGGYPYDISLSDIEVVAAWDAEQVYVTLNRWNEDSDGLTLAPFGPKPHSLGMALFAIKHDFGLYYTQPKSYNPDYSKGNGESWAYVVKWEGVSCFDRRVAPT